MWGNGGYTGATKGGDRRASRRVRPPKSIEFEVGLSNGHAKVAVKNLHSLTWIMPSLVVTTTGARGRLATIRLQF